MHFVWVLAAAYGSAAWAEAGTLVLRLWGFALWYFVVVRQQVLESGSKHVNGSYLLVVCAAAFSTRNDAEARLAGNRL